jgi:hypothetical protein
MKAQIEKNTERTGLSIRSDIKAAMEKLRIYRCRESGGYVSLGCVFGEAALLLLEREGIDLNSGAAAALPASKPVKSAKRKRVMAKAS